MAILFIDVRGSFLRFSLFRIFPAASAICHFGARSTGDIVENGRLESSPEPGHCLSRVEGRIGGGKTDRRVEPGKTSTSRGEICSN